VQAGALGSELCYVARDAGEWCRRVRELRTEEGWPIVTKKTGRPDLPLGVYVLEMDRQSPRDDRRIPDTLRGEVLRRDGSKCVKCGWHPSDWNKADPRNLELHHKIPHKEGGKTEADNLATLCNVCHDVVHAK